MCRQRVLLRARPRRITEREQAADPISSRGDPRSGTPGRLARRRAIFQPSKHPTMNTAQAIRPPMLLASRGNLGRETVKAGQSSRLRTWFACFADCFQSYDHYFAEMERSLPIRERERRRARRQADDLFHIAMLRG